VVVGVRAERVQPAREFSSMFTDALRQPNREVDAQTLFLGVLGASDAQGRPFMTDAELSRPAEFLLSHQLLAPFVRDLLPLAESSISAASEPGAAARDEINALKSQLEELQQTLKLQQKKIDELNVRLPKK
jgi:hypothetical protein